MDKSVLILIVILLFGSYTQSQNLDEKSQFEKFKRYRIFNDNVKSHNWTKVQTPEELVALTDKVKLKRLLISVKYNDTIRLSAFKGLEKFKNLEYLTIYSYSSKDLPAKISELQKLKYLNLGVNKVRDIPSEVLNLPLLQVLKINSNRLHSIPGSLANLSSLKRLEITGGSRIKSFPKNIESLKQLTHLKIRSYVDIPKSIESLQSLEYLIIDNGGGLKPSSIYTLNRLKYLYIDVNREKDLSGITGLSNLEMLDMRSNYITDEVAKLPMLKFLKITYNSSQTIPVSLIKIKQLEGLVLWTWPQLEKGIDHLNKLTQLRFLAINDCDNLKKVPYLQKLDKLSQLELYGNDSLIDYPKVMNGNKTKM